LWCTAQVDLHDRDEVTREYSKLTAPPLPRWPLATIGAAGLVLALTTTIGTASVIVRRRRSRTRSRSRAAASDRAVRDRAHRSYPAIEKTRVGWSP